VDEYLSNRCAEITQGRLRLRISERLHKSLFERGQALYGWGRLAISRYITYICIWSTRQWRSGSISHLHTAAHLALFTELSCSPSARFRNTSDSIQPVGISRLCRLQDFIRPRMSMDRRRPRRRWDHVFQRGLGQERLARKSGLWHNVSTFLFKS